MHIRCGSCCVLFYIRCAYLYQNIVDLNSLQRRIAVCQTIYKLITGVQRLSNPVEMTFDCFYSAKKEVPVLQQWFPRRLTGQNRSLDFEQGFNHCFPTNKNTCPSTLSSDTSDYSVVEVSFRFIILAHMFSKQRDKVFKVLITLTSEQNLLRIGMSPIIVFCRTFSFSINIRK